MVFKFVRAQTNLEEVEHSPFAHKYLLKRPRTHEHEPITPTVSVQGPAGNESHIDNPTVEKSELLTSTLIRLWPDRRERRALRASHRSDLGCHNW